MKSIGGGFGFVPDGLVLYEISPPLVKAFVDNFSCFVGHQKLSQQLFGVIRQLNPNSAGCPYCIDFKTGFLLNLGAIPQQLRAAREDVHQAARSESKKVLLDVAMAAHLTIPMVLRKTICRRRVTRH